MHDLRKIGLHDRKQQGRVGITTAAVIALLCGLALLYPLSIGPAIYAYDRLPVGSPAAQVLNVIYSPLAWACDQWRPTKDLMSWYMDMWSPP